MKYTKTTLMELSHKYRNILKKCFFLIAGGVLLTTPALAEASKTDKVVFSETVQDVLTDVATDRVSSMGVAGGDVFQGGGLWVQGLYNHSKQDKTAGNEGFKANTRGVAVGVDGKLSDEMTVGFGYGYTDTSADAGHRDVDVTGHHAFLYGQYQPSSWYANWLLGYSYSKYEETNSPLGEKMKAKYHASSYAAQLMSGYQFQTGFAPEAGFRYLLVDQESYTNGAQHIKSDKNDVLTGVAGVRYVKALNTEKITFVPHANVALTYDIMSEGSEANVRVIGGGDYQIKGERLHRFGFETGVGVTATINNLDLSLDYNGGFRKDFQSHTGMLKVKYNF